MKTIVVEDSKEQSGASEEPCRKRLTVLGCKGGDLASSCQVFEDPPDSDISIYTRTWRMYGPQLLEHHPMLRAYKDAACILAASIEVLSMQRYLSLNVKNRNDIPFL